jgi:general secretion pathway protein D
VAEQHDFDPRKSFTAKAGPDALHAPGGSAGLYERCSSHFLVLTRNSAIAALLIPALGIFTTVPQAIAQQAKVPAATSAQNSTPAALTQPPKTTDKAALPPPSPQQSAMARDLFRKGTQALHEHKSTQAMELLSQAHQLDPANVPYLAAYEIARQQIVSTMMQSAAADRKAGQANVAAKKLQQALKVDPSNPFVQEHLESMMAQEPSTERSNQGPQFHSSVVELQPTQGLASFHLRGNAQQIVQRVFQAYGINAIVDDSVPTQTVRFDLTNASFSEASSAVQLATDTFFVPLDPQRALVAKDTKENRAKFERLLLETVFLPGLNAKEMADPVNLVKNVFQVKQASVRPNNGVLTIRAPESTLKAINTTLSNLYVEKPEIILDVKIYQINDSRQETLGVQFPQALTVFNASSQLQSIISSNQSTIAQLISSGLVNPGDLAGIAALLVGLGLVQGTVFNQPFALFGNGLTLSGLSFGATTGNASLNIANTREIDHIQMRSGDSQEQTFLVGSRYPIITQSYSAGTQSPTASSTLASLISGSGAAGTQLSGVNPLATAPTVTYEDLGLTMKAAATVRKNDGIEMKLKIKIAALAGSSINGDPIINNESFTTALQVHDGDTAMMVSSVSEQQVRSISGIPGLSELPGFGWTASPNTQLIVGDLLIMITPRIVSGNPHSGVATQMVYVSPQS